MPLHPAFGCWTPLLELAGAAGMNLHTGSTTSGVADLLLQRIPREQFSGSGATYPLWMLMFVEAIQNSVRLVPAAVTPTVRRT